MSPGERLFLQTVASWGEWRDTLHLAMGSWAEKRNSSLATYIHGSVFLYRKKTTKSSVRGSLERHWAGGDRLARCGGVDVKFARNPRFWGCSPGFLESWFAISSSKMDTSVPCRYSGSWWFCTGLELKSLWVFSPGVVDVWAPRSSHVTQSGEGQAGSGPGSDTHIPCPHSARSSRAIAVCGATCPTPASKTESAGSEPNCLGRSLALHRNSCACRTLGESKTLALSVAIPSPLKREHMPFSQGLKMQWVNICRAYDICIIIRDYCWFITIKQNKY